MSDSEPVSQTALVVDDEKNVRLIFRQALEDLGLDVETASDGIEALDRLEDIDYDLMLLDLRLPGLGGLDVLQQARRVAPNLPIVVVTAHGTVRNAVQAMRRGAVDVLLKPISPDSLRDLVDRVLRRPSVEKTTAPYDEWVRLATWHARHRRTEEARHCLREAVKQDDRRPEAYTLLGILEGTDGDAEKACRHLEAALEREPDGATAQHLLERAQDEEYPFSTDRPEVLLPSSSPSKEVDITPERKIVSSHPEADITEPPYRVLAVLNERIAEGTMAADRALMQLAVSSARAHVTRELLLLTVVEVPRQLTLTQAKEAYQNRLREVQWQLDALADETMAKTLPVHPIVVVARQTAPIVKNVVTEQSVQHVVGVWSETSEDDSGEAASWAHALDDASCEVTFLRPSSEISAEGGTDVTAFVHDGPYAPFVARRALEWAQRSGVATLNLLTVEHSDGSASAKELELQGSRLLRDVADRAGLDEEQYEGRVLVAKDVDTAVERCARSCDRICVGTSRSSTWVESVFGSIPEKVLTSAECPVALVRGPWPNTRPVLKDLGCRLAGA